MRPAYLVPGLVLLILGAAVVFYEVSESCEDSPLAGAYRFYPWCSDVLDHINFTFVGVLALFAGAIILALGGRLHWLLEPFSKEGGDVGGGDGAQGADATLVRT